jgi:ABC-2 type transport system ATP-binding protein
MIKIQNLQFNYHKEHPLISNLTLTLETGNIYGLLGKNGAGKTTLLKLIAGMLFPQSGTCRVNGIESRKRLPQALADLYFIPEEFELTGKSATHLMEQQGSFYPKFDNEAYFSYLETFKVNVRQSFKHLSFGQKKQVIISFGLASNTNYLLLDEPTNGLDIPSKSIFRKMMAGAINNERSFIISTHQIRDLESMIDPLIILDNGKVIFKHTMDNISTKLTFSEDDNENAQAIWSEKSFHTFQTITAAQTNQYSKPDLELLFKAVTDNPHVFDPIFNQ